MNVNVNWSSFSGQSAKSLANHAVSSNIPLPLLGIKYFISTQGCMIFDTDKFAKKKQQKQFCIKYFTSVVFDKLIKRKARTKYTSYSILSRIRLNYLWLFSKPLSTPLKNYTLFLFEKSSIAMCFFLHLTNTCTFKVQNTTPMFLYKLTLGKGNHSVTWWQPCKLSIFLD